MTHYSFAQIVNLIMEVVIQWIQMIHNVSYNNLTISATDIYYGNVAPECPIAYLTTQCGAICGVKY